MPGPARGKPRRLEQTFDPRLSSHYSKISIDHYSDHEVLQRKANYVFDVRDFGAVGDGAINDTEPIQGAVDAAQQAGGGIVEVPPGTFLVDSISIPSFKVSLRGYGSSITSFHHSSPAGAVVTFADWQEGSNFLTSARYGGFSIIGNGIDGSEIGLNAARASGGIGVALFSDIAIRQTGGPAVYADQLYLSTFRDCIFGRPDGIDEGFDVPYVELRASNGTRLFNCGFRSLSGSPDAPSGMLRLSNGVAHRGHDLVVRDCWTEYPHPNTVGVYVENDTCTLSGWSFFDQSTSTPGTAWVEIAGNGNMWDSKIPGTYTLQTETWYAGVRVSGNRNRIDGIKGFTGGGGPNVVLEPGASYNAIIAAGQDSGVPGNSAPVVDDRSGNSTNTLLDMTNGSVSLQTTNGR